MGSKMVLVEMCSDVEGSKRVIEPCALPIDPSMNAKNICFVLPNEVLTKSDIAIAHEACDIDRLIRREAGYLPARQDVPSNACVSGIITHGEPAGAALTRIVDRDPFDVFMVSLKSSLDRECVMVKDKYGTSLRIEKVRAGRGARFEGLFDVLGR